MIKFLIKKLFRRPYGFIKRHATKLLVSYLIGFLPIGYSMTALTTNISFTDISSVVTVMKNSGIANILSAGTLQPIVNGSKVLVGNTITFIGNTINSQEIIQNGTNLVKEFEGWFNQQITSTKNSINQIIISDDPSNNNTTDWTFDKFPNYYEIVGISHINPAQFPEQGMISYSPLDDKGRTQIVKGTITHKNVINSAKSTPLRYNGTELDVNFSGKDDNPSGWPQGKNEKVSIPWLYGRSYNGYMFNKSHLIADSLGGDAIAANAITGTRTQNVGGPDQKGGMRYIEIKVTEYLKNNKNGIVYYSAEPIYNENESIPRKVVVKALSDDKSIDEEVVIYNYANGWIINYTDASISSN